MNKEVTGIVAYITIVGWLIAYFAGDKEGAKFHLNQALVINICAIVLGILSRIPLLSFVLLTGILSLAVAVLAVIGIIYAASDQDKELPFIGTIKILK
jgi:uncharacterized membrane protein